MQAFLQNPTHFHLSLSSTESYPRVWKPHTLLLLILLQEGTFVLKLHCNPMLQPPNMHASIFTESNTVPPFIVINRVSSPSLEATPTSALVPITRGNFSIKTPHCNPMLHAPKHPCKHFYRIQHISTFRCHQLSLIPDFGSHTPFCSRSHYKRECFY